jgi:hypothetical protein
MSQLGSEDCTNELKLNESITLDWVSGSIISNNLLLTVSFSDNFSDPVSDSVLGFN